MKDKYIILRNVRPANRDIFLGFNPRGTEAEASANLVVEVEEVERREVSALTHNADVVAVAPAIPMKLIEPFEVITPQSAAAEGTAWGVQAVGADTSAFSGDGVVVAILDTGIDATHPAFSGTEIIQKDFTGLGDGDEHGHGTHCAGTVFGKTVNGVRIGVAPDVKRALVGKVLGGVGGSSMHIVRAIQWAVDEGANVISMSLGIDFPGFVKQLLENDFPPELATSRALEGYRANLQLFERLATLIRAQGAFSAEAVLIAAAGNESRRDVNPKFEIAVSPPAVAEGIISVGALGRGERGFVVAPFSNTGPVLSGPGVEIISAKSGGGLKALSGTSMATPHVAGVAALWSEKIKRTRPVSALQLTSMLIGSAVSDALQAGFDPFDVGVGMVRAPQL